MASGWYDYGARFYDPEIGRFHTQNRFAEKYFSLTSYQYGANNPILYIDVNGDSLSVTGNQTAVDKYNAIVNAGLGGFYTTKVDKNGLVTLESTGKKGDMTEEQKVFYGVMSEITDLKKGNVSVGLVESDENVLIGSYELGSIDVDDIAKFPTTGSSTSQGALSHELAEQASKQLDGQFYSTAHYVKGLGAEDKVNNSTRGSTQSTTKTTQNSKGQISGNLDIRFIKETTVNIVSIHLTNNNVTKIEVK